MAATPRHSQTIKGRLEGYRRRQGNWRLKGLLLAASEAVDAETVGAMWPRPRPRRQRDYVNLAARHEGSHEHALARDLYDVESVRTGEVVPRDKYISRALIAETGRELDVLWREELLDTVISGAATRKMAREVTMERPVEAKQGDLPTPNQEPFASASAEGSTPDMQGEGYSATAYNCEKFEQGFAVTDNLIEAAEVDTIERHITWAGAAIENAINRQYLTNCIDNAGNTNSGVGNEASVQIILEAAEYPADSDFDPVNVAVLHPELLTELADDPAVGYLDFSRRTLDEDIELQEGTRRQAGRAVGPTLWIASDATYNGLSGEPLPTTNTWGWESGSEVGAVVHGKPFVHTVIYRDIDVSELQEPITAIHDIQGGVARAYTDSVQPSNNAIASVSQ